MELIRIIEVEGNSRESWEDAVGRAVSEATKLLRPMITAVGDKPVAGNRLTYPDDYSARGCVAFIVQIPGAEINAQTLVLD